MKERFDGGVGFYTRGVKCMTHCVTIWSRFRNLIRVMAAMRLHENQTRFSQKILQDSIHELHPINYKPSITVASIVSFSFFPCWLACNWDTVI